MNKKTRALTSSALLISLSMVFLYLSSFFPTMQMSFVAATSFCVAVQMIETGDKASWGVFAGSCILGLIIIPDKTSVILYALFFGYYPIIKSYAERLNKPVLRWGVKLVVMNIALAVIIKFFGELIFEISALKYGMWLFIAMFELCFILFDIVISRLAALYIIRFHKKRRY